MSFVNRESELASLHAQYGREGSALIIIYGRRRVGKTRLIREFLGRRRGLYFLATEESEHQNLEVFQRLVAEHLDNDLLRTVRGADWEALFRLIGASGGTEKAIVVIDEFQYLSKGNPAFPSVFQRIWDNVLKDSNVMVILCGSLVSMMESQTLSYSSPLYGRRTGQIRLGQMDFAHYRAFFPDFDERKLIEYYAVTGGVPRYIEVFRGTSDIYQAIRTLVLDKQSYLYEEPAFLLKSEVSEIGSYFSLIRTIADGNQKLGRISTKLEVKQTSLTKYIRTLIDLDILERQVPITELHPEKSKMGMYRLKDNFIEFWFRFVYPHMAQLEFGNAEYVMDVIRRDFVARHVSFVYERVCIGRMQELNRQGVMHFSRIGRWWSRDTEIDIVALDSDSGDRYFAECKYTASRTGTDVLYSLMDKAKRVPAVRDGYSAGDRYVLFSMEGYTPELEQLARERDDILLLSEPPDSPCLPSPRE